jgi:preprotein translocase subunit SecD
MDNKVKAYARIQEAIRESVRITGFGVDEAQNLALVLRTAALPVDLEIINQQAVGASLGADAIRQGIQAILYGFILVVAFMLLYYKGAGLIADLALMLNLFFIIATLSVFNFTLTLTSIAGIVLTVGMAVDANVIIFERIKEEYRLGKSAKASIDAGFSKAFWSIMDANITTLIASIFLSQLGKGPIQGFAITLSVGIITSMFTALFVSRLIYDFFTDVVGTTKLSISWRLRA